MSSLDSKLEVEVQGVGVLSLPKLRPLELSDAAQAYTACRLYTEGLAWTTRSSFPRHDAMSYLLAADSAWWRYGSPTLGVVGLAGFEHINLIDGVAEPYVAIDSKSRREGYGLAMGEQLRTVGVKQLGLRRIQAEVLSDAPSIGVLEKMGFSLEGVREAARLKDGELKDVRLYAWLRS